jgi:hypothetical protein
MQVAPGGAAHWTSHPPQEQKTQVQIPPGYNVFRAIIAMLLYLMDLHCWRIKLRNKGIDHN